MIRRIRMARKRLGIAREVFSVLLRQCCAPGVISQSAWRRLVTNWRTLRAIERRKDKTA